MASLSRYHQELGPNGEGKCSVPMWSGGCPAGFCDEPAFGVRPIGKTIRMRDGRIIRVDGLYDGYVPALACPAHGGPQKPVEEETPNG